MEVQYVNGVLYNNICHWLFIKSLWHQNEYAHEFYFEYFGYILNKHASFRSSVSKALFILIQQIQLNWQWWLCNNSRWKKKKKKDIQAILRGLSLMQIYFNQFKTDNYLADISNYLFNITIYGLCDNILEDDDSNLFRIFINGESNSARVIGKMINDCLIMNIGWLKITQAEPAHMIFALFSKNFETSTINFYRLLIYYLLAT